MWRVGPYEPYRMAFCELAGCAKQFFVCTRCDRGQRYCGPEHAEAARLAHARRRGAKYRRTFKARRKAAARQARFREKKKVTHAGSPSPGLSDTVPAPATETTEEVVSAGEEQADGVVDGVDAFVRRGRGSWCGRRAGRS